MQCIYIDRAGTKDVLDQTVGVIVERQKTNETSDLNWPPLMIFAEGGVSNGKNLSKFKRGAFMSLKPVKPLVTKHHWNNV